MPSITDSRITLSGESFRFSKTLTTLIPLTLSFCLYIAESYLSLEKRSSLCTITILIPVLSASQNLIIFWNSGLLADVADFALSIKVFTICMLFLFVYSSIALTWASIDSSIIFTYERYFIDAIFY